MVEIFKLVSYYSADQFTMAVNDYLHSGWDLYGSPFSAGQSGYYCQAVVKWPNKNLRTLIDENPEEDNNAERETD